MAPGKSLLFVASGFVIVNHGLFDVEWVNMGGNGKIWGLTHWGWVTNIWVSNLGYHLLPWIGVYNGEMGRDNFFHITSGRINTWKGVNQLKELFFLNLIIIFFFKYRFEIDKS